MPTQTLTTKEAAELLKMTDSRVRQLILENRLPAKKHGHVWLIQEQDLDSVRGLKRGPKPKK